MITAVLKAQLDFAKLCPPSAKIFPSIGGLVLCSRTLFFTLSELTRTWLWPFKSSSLSAQQPQRQFITAKKSKNQFWPALSWKVHFINMGLVLFQKYFDKH